MKKFIILLALISLFQIASANSRNYDSGGESAMNRTWRYENLTVAAKGEFLNTADGKVFIEGDDHIISLNIYELHWEDRKFIYERSKKIKGMIERHVEHTKNFVENKHYEAKVEFFGHTKWISVSMFLLTCFLLFKAYKRRLEQL